MLRSQNVLITIKAESAVPTLTNINLSFPLLSVTTGYSNNMTATAYDQNNKPMPGVDITLIESGSSQTATGKTGTSGTTTFILSFSSTGMYTFHAQSGNIVSNEITIDVSAPVPPVISSVKVSASATEIKPDSAVTFYAQALDSDGNGVSGAWLYLLETSPKSVPVQGKQADSTGKVEFSPVAIPNSGIYDFVVTASTTNGGTTESTSSTVTVTVEPSAPATASITLVASTTTPAVDEQVTFTATAYDSSGNPSQGETIQFRMNFTATCTDSTTLFTGTTDSNGNVYFEMAYGDTGTVYQCARDENTGVISKMVEINVT